MQIENDVKLDFDDVLIKPKRSELTSRSEVNLFKDYKFKYSKYTYHGIPIIASNMATVATFDMHYALKKHGLSTALHKHYDFDQYVKFFESEYEYPTFYTSGITKSNYENLLKLKNVLGDKLRYISIDVANGHMQSLVKYIEQLRNNPLFHDDVIMAGTVADGDMAEALVLAGADIVRAGIGSGCLAGDTRILMSNGTYKDIKDIKVHDRVINMNGDPVEVIGVQFSGIKKVKKYKSNLFYKSTHVTPDHLHFVGDHSMVKDVQKMVLREVLGKPDDNGESKLKWKPTDQLAESVLLTPRHIKFEMRDSFVINLKDYAHANRDMSGYREFDDISPSYDLGYIFGTYLGDGCAVLRTSKRIRDAKVLRNTSGSNTWYFGKHEEAIADKLISAIKNVFGLDSKKEELVNMVQVHNRNNTLTRFLLQFGKKDKKAIPEKFWCSDRNYINGLLDGLNDSDGGLLDDGRMAFTNTSPTLIEQYSVLFYIANGYFPSIVTRKGTAGGLKIDDPSKSTFKDSYICRNVIHPEWSTLDNHQVARFYDIEDVEVEIPTYDIQVADDTHSFIANNVIVHNSVCTTRVLTGVGVPQLSLMMDVSDSVHGLDAHCVSDGGHRIPADIAKAFGAGSDFVMLGGMLAGHDESGGKIIEQDGKKYIEFYGMSSTTAQNNFNGGVQNHRASEGKRVLIPHRGSVDNTALKILGALRSTCSYVGAKKLKELPKRTTFIRVNRTHNTYFGDDWMKD